MGANCATHVPQACAQSANQKSPRTPKANTFGVFFFCTVKTPKVAACSSGLCKAEDDDVSRLTMWEHDVEAVKEDVGAPFILGQKKGLYICLFLMIVRRQWAGRVLHSCEQAVQEAEKRQQRREQEAASRQAGISAASG